MYKTWGMNHKAILIKDIILRYALCTVGLVVWTASHVVRTVHLPRGRFGCRQSGAGLSIQINGILILFQSPFECKF